MAKSSRRHGYKEVRLQQLRSFCAVARLGSQSAAADALGVAQPTVWEQIHALERDFGVKLVDPSKHGCRMTRAGRSLALLATPLIEHFDSLKRNFLEAQRRSVSFTLGSTPRILLEDLAAPIQRFVERSGNVKLSIWEMFGEEVGRLLEQRHVDLAISGDLPETHFQGLLVIEPLYELDLLLIAPPNHPLARKRSVTPRDLSQYPVLNSPKGGFTNPQLSARLDRLRIFSCPERRVEANLTSVVRRLVETGLGIGLVPGIAGQSRSGLHERSMSDHLGKVPVHAIWRQGDLAEEHFRDLGAVVREHFETLKRKRGVKR